MHCYFIFYSTKHFYHVSAKTNKLKSKPFCIYHDADAVRGIRVAQSFGIYRAYPRIHDISKDVPCLLRVKIIYRGCLVMGIISGATVCFPILWLIIPTRFLDLASPSIDILNVLRLKINTSAGHIVLGFIFLYLFGTAFIDLAFICNGITFEHFG